MSITSDWATTRCEPHDMVSCADCLERNRLRRVGADVRYQGDCGVDTFVELTGADYEFAAEVLLASGFVPGSGVQMAGLRAAFESVGFAVVDRTGMSLDEALVASRDGRDFFVCGFTRTKKVEGHAWTISGGKVRRDFFRSRRIVFKLYEVTA